jgi:hypothetical protein
MQNAIVGVGLPVGLRKVGILSAVRKNLTGEAWFNADREL